MSARVEVGRLSESLRRATGFFDNLSSTISITLVAEVPAVDVELLMVLWLVLGVISTAARSTPLPFRSFIASSLSALSRRLWVVVACSSFRVLKFDDFFDEPAADATEDPEAVSADFPRPLETAVGLFSSSSPCVLNLLVVRVLVNCSCTFFGARRILELVFRCRCGN